MRRLTPSLLLLALGCASAAELSSPTVAAKIDGGVVVGLENRLTGETLYAPPADLSGWWTKTGPGKFAWHGGTATETDGGYRLQTVEGEVDTRFGVDGDAVTVEHSGRTNDGGLRGIQWGLTVADDAALLIPGYSGQRFTAEHYTNDVRLDYPQAWECQFILLEMPLGGFLIRAVDDAKFYKTLRLKKVRGAWQIGFETQAYAPWDDATEVPSASWRIEAYRGDWTVGAALYREWAARAWGLKTLAEQQPAWVDEVALVVISGLDPKLLDALAAKFDPRRTLLYVPSWRHDPYDRNYPDYTPADGVPAQVKAARARGFRVMLHVNYFGCTPENPAYQELQAYHALSPYNNQPTWWNWTRATPPIKFAYINPGANAWRRLFIGKMEEVIAATGADALHLDQTLCIYNDARGLIDGHTMMQGSLLLHQELRQALPQVALSGEGLDEITFRHEAFTQRHLRGLSHSESTWDPDLIAQSHAISSAILRPYTGIYGYLGLCQPTNRDLYLAWRAGNEKFGVIPTIARPDVAMLASNDPAVAQIYDRAKLWADQALTPLFSDYTPETLFAYQAKSGERYEWRRVEGGTALVSGTGKVLARRYQGTTEIVTAGSIDGAVAWDDQRVFGLDPERSYLVSPSPRDPAAPHVVASSSPVVLGGVLQTGQLGLLDLKDAGPTTKLWKIDVPITSGCRLRDGQVRSEPGLGLSDASGSSVSRRGDSLFAHPPWHTEVAGPAKEDVKVDGLGETFIRFELTLPDQPVRFHTQVGLDPKAKEETCDGVTFRVTVTSGQDVKQAEVHATADQNEELNLDLSAFAGRQVALDLTDTPGPAGDPQFDWALWIRPELQPATAELITLELATTAGWGAAVGAPGAQLEPWSNGRQRLRVASPATVFLSPAAPVEAKPGLALADLSPAVLVRQNGGQLSGPFGFARVGPAELTVDGVTKHGLAAHPPSHGTTSACFALSLPEAPLSLSGFYGLREGNKSKGAGFLIRVNGRSLWEVAAPGGEHPWEPFEIPLGDFRGQRVLLELVVDSLGAFDFDWTSWGEVQFQAQHAGD